MNESIVLMRYFCATVMVAGYVRGYGGFGFSMITVAALSLYSAPAQVVPMVLLLEVAASLVLLPGIWRLVNWPDLSWLLTGDDVVSTDACPVGQTVSILIENRIVRYFHIIGVMP